MMEIDRHFGPTDLAANPNIKRKDQLEHGENFLNTEGGLTLVHCVSCDTENHAMAATFGRCAWCCWSDEDRNFCERCHIPNTKPQDQRSVLVKNIWTHYFLCDECSAGFGEIYRNLELTPESYEKAVVDFMETPQEVIN